MVNKNSFNIFLSIVYVLLVILLGVAVEIGSKGLTLSSAILAAFILAILFLRYLDNT